MKKICHFHVRCYERNYFKTKIWMAAIIINFIIKHHGLLTYRCRVLHENIKIISMFVFRMTVATKL